MAEQWYYVQQGQRNGPVSEQEIRQLISSGQVQPNDLVWKQGMAQWTQASQVFLPPSSDQNALPPVPSETGNKAKGLAASLLSRGKEAAQLAVKQAERTKITTINLPSSYQALGKHVYKSGSHRNDLTTPFQQIDGFLNEIKTIQARSASQPKAAGIADKAAAAAKATKDAAQVKVLQMKANHAVGQLGKAAFETYGEQSGPQELVRPITDLLARVAALDGELSKLQGSGLPKQVRTFWNANKENPLFIGPLLLCCFPVGLFLVWKHSVWTSKTKWIWTGAFAALVIVGMIGSHGQDQRGGSISGKAEDEEFAVEPPSGPPRSDYSKGPNGEVPRAFTIYRVKEGDRLERVESLDGRPGTILKDNEIILANGHHVQHGKITWTNEIGSDSFRWGNEWHEFFVLQGKGEMYFWGGVPEGTLQQWYPNGNKWLELPCIGGKRNGLAREWHENGSLKTKVLFVDDKLQGHTIEYYKNGSKRAEGTYKDYEPDGVWTWWYPNGQLSYKTPFTNGKPGPATHWDEDGTLLYDTTSSVVYQKGFDGGVMLAEPALGILDAAERLAKEGYRSSSEKEYAAARSNIQDQVNKLLGAIKDCSGDDPYLREARESWQGKLAGYIAALKKRGIQPQSLGP